MMPGRKRWQNTNGFRQKQSVEMPVVIGNMSCDELNRELQKGIRSLASGKALSIDEVDAALFEEFGI